MQSYDTNSKPDFSRKSRGSKSNFSKGLSMGNLELNQNSSQDFNM